LPVQPQGDALVLSQSVLLVRIAQPNGLHTGPDSYVECHFQPVAEVFFFVFGMMFCCNFLATIYV
jgi:hypothetical protein